MDIRPKGESQPNHTVLLTQSEATWIGRPIYLLPNGDIDPEMHAMQLWVEDAQASALKQVKRKLGYAGLKTYGKDTSGNEVPVIEVELSDEQLGSIFTAAQSIYIEKRKASMNAEDSVNVKEEADKDVLHAAYFGMTLADMQVVGGIMAEIRNAREDGRLPTVDHPGSAE